MNPFLFALFAVLLTLTGPASAEPNKTTTSAPPALPNDVGLGSNETGQAASDPTSQARVLYLKGNAAFKDDDLIIARDYYKKSLELRESFDAFCNLGRAEELSVLLDGAYYHLGLCVKYYPPDVELAATGKKYADLHKEVGKRLSAEEVVAIDMKVSAHRLKTEEEPVAVTPVEPSAATEPTPAPQAVEPSETQGHRRHIARTSVSVGLGVLGAAGVGVGVGFLVDSQNLRDDRSGLVERMDDQDIDCSQGEDNHPSCALRDELDKKADLHRTLGIALTASGGALLVGSTLLYFLWPQGKAGGDARNGPSSGETARGWVQVGQVALRPEVQVWSPNGGTFWGLSGKF